MKKIISALVAALVPVAMLSGVVAEPALATVTPGAPLSCTSGGFYTDGTKNIYKFNSGTDSFDWAFPSKHALTTSLDGLSYDSKDNYLYGWNAGHLYEVDNGGNEVDLGAQGLSATLESADYWPSADVIISATNATWYSTKVAANSASATTSLAVAASNASGSSGNKAEDHVLIPRSSTVADVYGLDSGNMYDTVVTLNSSGVLASAVTHSVSVGSSTVGASAQAPAAYSDAAGNVYFVMTKASQATHNIVSYTAAQLAGLFASPSIAVPSPRTFASVTSVGGNYGTQPSDGAGCKTAPSMFSPTSVTTSAATVNSSSATISGSVTPGNFTGANITAGNAVICYSTSAQVDANGLLKDAPVCSTNSLVVATNAASTPIDPFVLTGLAAGTYYFQAKATNSLGYTNSGTVLSFTIAGVAAAVAPSANTDPAPSAFATTTATIGGNVSTGSPAGSEIDGTTGSSGIYVLWSTSPTTTNGELGTVAAPATSSSATPFTLVANSSATNVSVSLTGLTPGATYYYQVKATNASGLTDYGTVESFTTAFDATVAPSVTTTAPATSVSESGATLGGTVTTGSISGEAVDAGNANICYSTDSHVDPATGQLDTNTTCVDATPSSVSLNASALAISLTLTGLSSGTTYYYQANASNQRGQVGFGSVQSFATLAIYTVTWAGNGGTVSPSSSTQGSVGGSVTAPTPSQSGYTFSGWACSPDGSPASPVAAGVSFTPSATTTCTAQWTAISAPSSGSTYVVSFVNLGTTVSSTNGEAGTVITCPAAPTRAGYVFQSWSGCAAGANYTVTGSATLTAIWIEALAAQPNATGGQNGHVDEKVSLEVNAALTGQQYVDPAVGIRLTLTPNEANKTQAPLNSQNQVVFQDGRLAKVTGSGLRANSDVQVYISKSAIAGLVALPIATAGVTHAKTISFANPVLLGTLHTDANGAFSDWLPIPAGLEAGAHVLQVDGYAPDWSVHSANFPVLYAVAHTYKRTLTVYFTPNSAKFTAATAKAVSALIALLPKTGQQFEVTSKGFVFPVDSHTANMQISSARAKAVAMALENGILAIGQKAAVEHVGLGRINIAKQTSRRVEASVSWTVLSTQG